MPVRLEVNTSLGQVRRHPDFLIVKAPRYAVNVLLVLNFAYLFAYGHLSASLMAGDLVQPQPSQTYRWAKGADRDLHKEFALSVERVQKHGKFEKSMEMAKTM